MSWPDLTRVGPTGPARLAPTEAGQVVEWRCESSDRAWQGQHRYHLETDQDWLKELPEGIGIVPGEQRSAVIATTEDPTVALHALFEAETAIEALTWLLSDDRVPRQVRRVGLQTLGDRSPTASPGPGGLATVRWTTGDRSFWISVDPVDLAASGWGWGPAEVATPDEALPGRPPGTWPGFPAELRCELVAATIESATR